MKLRALAHLFVLLFPTLVSAATITVRKDGTGDYRVIQQALDAVANGDTILIGPGEYLESSTVRFPAWSWDIQSYANVMVDDLTIMGSGSDQTFVGPTSYSGNYSLFSPKGMTYIESGTIRIANLCLRNCYDGVFIRGTVFMDGCVIENHSNGVSWEPVGSGGWIRNSAFDVSTPQDAILLDVGYGGQGNNILIENCSFNNSESVVRGVDGATFRDCTIANYLVGLAIYYDSRVILDHCKIADIQYTGVAMSLGAGSVCQILDSEIQGGQRALETNSGGRFEVTDSRLEGGTMAVLNAVHSPASCTIHNCDLIKGSGPVIVCSSFGSQVIHDLSGNYWGTSSEAEIQSWIIDGNDDPNIRATVLYSPFSSQPLPTESTSWGDLKALFR